MTEQLICRISYSLCSLLLIPPDTALTAQMKTISQRQAISVPTLTETALQIWTQSQYRNICSDILTSNNKTDSEVDKTRTLFRLDDYEYDSPDFTMEDVMPEFEKLEKESKEKPKD